MLCPFPEQENIAEVAIEDHVRAPSGLPGYDATPEHREFSKKAGFVMICALQRVPDGTIFRAFSPRMENLEGKDDDSITAI